MRRGKLAGTAGLLATVALAVAPPAGATTIFTQTPESPYTGSGTSPTASFASLLPSAVAREDVGRT